MLSILQNKLDIYPLDLYIWHMPDIRLLRKFRGHHVTPYVWNSYHIYPHQVSICVLVVLLFFLLFNSTKCKFHIWPTYSTPNQSYVRYNLLQWFQHCNCRTDYLSPLQASIYQWTSKPGYYYDTIMTISINYIHYDTIMTILLHLSLLQSLTIMTHYDKIQQNNIITHMTFPLWPLWHFEYIITLMFIMTLLYPLLHFELLSHLWHWSTIIGYYDNCETLCTLCLLSQLSQ
jgi:hypothetical protein